MLFSIWMKMVYVLFISKPYISFGFKTAVCAELTGRSLVSFWIMTFISESEVGLQTRYYSSVNYFCYTSLHKLCTLNLYILCLTSKWIQDVCWKISLRSWVLNIWTSAYTYKRIHTSPTHQYTHTHTHTFLFTYFLKHTHKHTHTHTHTHTPKAHGLHTHMHITNIQKHR